MTGLETLLIAICSIIITAIVTISTCGRRYVCKDDCTSRHDKADKKDEIMFRILRALVVYSNIPAEEKERLLNERGTK